MYRDVNPGLEERKSWLQVWSEWCVVVRWGARRRLEESDSGAYQCVQKSTVVSCAPGIRQGKVEMVHLGQLVSPVTVHIFRENCVTFFSPNLYFNFFQLKVHHHKLEVQVKI